ncbi:hypothetical protein FQN57_001071 [Myotisia sp. PD_48]|nr:hypothetical protein FQN57_001071 [Myotisia sp. PD_48]
MSGISVHRHIGLALYVGVFFASKATGEELSEEGFMKITDVCSLLGDLADLRSDTRRKQRENTVIRGVRGCLCEYLDSTLASTLSMAAEAIESGRLSALVVLGFVNWIVMSSHHKTYEIVGNVSDIKRYPACKYDSIENNSHYAKVIEALKPYGTLGELDAPTSS